MVTLRTGSVVTALLEVANRGFAERLAAVRSDDWSRPTPCSEWDVRALVNHVVGANVRYLLILRGASLADVEATRDADHLGADAFATFTTTAAAVVDAFDEPDVLDRSFRHVVGERTGRELLDMRILDVAIHTWDLARAIGADETIEPEIVAFGLSATSRREGEDDDAAGQERLLRRFGRLVDEVPGR